MGFTNRCVGILAHIAELAKQCEPQRIDEDGNIREDFRPTDDIVIQAQQIQRELEEGLSDPTVYKGCNHRSSDSSESEGAWDATEIYATNEMFHWAGLIHLFRRVLGKPAVDPEVQHAVREIVGLLYKVRRGSTAEACLLFPMFAAGCDARDEGQREKIMERLRCVEGFGMTQVCSSFHQQESKGQMLIYITGPQSSLSDAESLGYRQAMGVSCFWRVLWLAFSPSFSSFPSLPSHARFAYILITHTLYSKDFGYTDLSVHCYINHYYLGVWFDRLFIVGVKRI